MFPVSPPPYLNTMTKTATEILMEGVKNKNRTIEKVDKRKFNRGHPQSGRKPKESTLIEKGVKEWFDEHMKEQVEVQIQDPKTGVKRMIKMTRLMRVLQKLYEIGVRGEGSADALNKWLDRMIGRPLQKIVGDENEPIVLRVDF